MPSDSLELFEKSHFSKNEPIIDIGGGASFLIDELIHNGFTDVTLLDISPIAVSESQARLGAKVQYINAEITQWTPERTYAVWHDRAVFHFLTSAEQQQNYLNAFLSATTSNPTLFARRRPALPRRGGPPSGRRSWRRTTCQELVSSWPADGKNIWNRMAQKRPSLLA